MAEEETTVDEIMSSPVATVTSDTTVTEAAQTLREQSIGSPVVGQELIEGIVTETDVVGAV